MLTKLISFDIKIPIQAINFYEPLWAGLMADVGAPVLQLTLKFFYYTVEDVRYLNRIYISSLYVGSN